MTNKIPQNILNAAHHTIYIAMVFCRNIALSEDRDNNKIIYELMDALHEVPNILARWGTYDNDTNKLRQYFGYFNHSKWNDDKRLFSVPDLVSIFEEKIKS